MYYSVYDIMHRCVLSFAYLGKLLSRCCRLHNTTEKISVILNLGCMHHFTKEGSMTLREIRERAMQLMHSEVSQLEIHLEREQREQDLLQEKIFQLSDSMKPTSPIASQLHEIEQYQNELSHTLEKIKHLDSRLAKAKRRLERMVKRSELESWYG